MSEYNCSFRVYFEDTDAGGIVYHASYLRFAERARSDWLRQYGFHQSDIIEDGYGFVVRKLTIEYLAPAKLDDLLEIKSSLKHIGSSSLIMQQDFARDATSIAKMEVGLVCIGKNFKPIRIPEKIREIF